MFLFSLRVVADGDVGFKNLTYGFFAVSQWLNDKSKGYDAFDLAVFRRPFGFKCLQAAGWYLHLPFRFRFSDTAPAKSRIVF